MDLRNKNTRKILTLMLEKHLKSVMAESVLNVRVQDQLMRFQQDEDQRRARQKKNEASPQLIRTHSQSDHVQFYQRQQSQLKLKNERLQQSKEKSIQQRMEQEISEATFHPKILKSKNSNIQPKSGNQIYQQGLKWMQQKVINAFQIDKADHIDKMKESSMIQISQENLFKPTVNKVSEKILKQTNQTDFYMRMNRNETKKQEHIKKLRTDTTPTFKPKINNRSKKMQSTLNKDILQVSVNLELLEKIKDYKKQDFKLSALEELSRSRNCRSALSQSIDMETKNSQYPSFRQETTIKKQPKLQIDFHSPNNNMTEMLYEALGQSDYF